VYCSIWTWTEPQLHLSNEPWSWAFRAIFLKNWNNGKLNGKAPGSLADRTVWNIFPIFLQIPCTVVHLLNDHVEPSSQVLDQNKFSLILICSSVLFFFSLYSCCLHDTRKWRMTAGFLRQSVCSGRASPEHKNAINYCTVQSSDQDPEMEFLDINLTKDSSLLLHANAIQSNFYWRIL
jgi:hypothetical protein